VVPEEVVGVTLDVVLVELVDVVDVVSLVEVVEVVDLVVLLVNDAVGKGTFKPKKPSTSASLLPGIL